MALLASQIPILYCLMYFQSNRRSVLNQSHSTLLDTLASHRQSRTRDSKELFEHERLLLGRNRGAVRLSSSLEERSWVRHRDQDPRKLCLERYAELSQTSTSRPNKRQLYNNNHPRNIDDCSKKRQEGVNRIMSERFMTVEELQNILPEMTKSQHGVESKPSTRYKAEGLPYANLKAFGDSHCSICDTEIGYEVMTQIQDLKGVNHTVVNFHNAYQFIPAGRCVNENSPCGGGGNARCIQIYRAQWTLVWTASSRTRLVTHEVPSHCQCVNVGANLGSVIKSPLANTIKSAEVGTVSIMNNTGAHTSSRPLGNE